MEKMACQRVGIIHGTNVFHIHPHMKAAGKGEKNQIVAVGHIEQKRLATGRQSQFRLAIYPLTKVYM
ncbi:hypothetical protein DBB_41360 [Desulfoluna spongiiphila]|nr:hypothetical protein DBB_41360 [Desulfoluna spongiiphila]